MTTWSDFLTEIRADLQDTSGTPRWSNQMLWVYAKDAIRDYSTWFPKRVDRKEISPTNGAYLLPTNFIEEIHVECPVDTFLEKRVERPGTMQRQVAATLCYFIQGGNVYLNTTPQTPIFLTYLSVHEVPTSEDTVFTFTIPDSDLELIRLYIKAKLYEQMRSRQASLDRFKLGTGSRDDNPIMPEVIDLMKVYLQKIAERIRGGAIILYRPGKLK